ncbi:MULTISPECIES: DUF192 domain-containing protein [Galbibacter]|uniref:DUF192 domain-containing protein n=1 Tax=Galbibacter pacificus TaxID=2996052 RepID=A0ABT6FMB7_9FLAO|nr:DUF192 domain-containing protein [Galbibacter pacificus]MDG3580930.1 DUF192 domain-containing protein [Galbibacter pacificus]MDG3584408.1 DUF192 domain-containing protein [Galbibacter pacificus]
MINFLFRVLLVLIFLCLTLISCESNTKKEVKTETVSFKKEGELSIYKGDSLSVKKIDIEIADNEYERQTGLMYRPSMKKDRGMLFIFEDEEPRYFYMKNTEIPLDIIYIDADKKIVSLVKNAHPMNEASLPSNFPAKYVLELNGGMTDELKIEKGDRINYKETK